MSIASAWKLTDLIIIIVVVVVVVAVVVVFGITKGKTDIGKKAIEQGNSAANLELCSHYTDSIRIVVGISFTLLDFSFSV